MSGDTHVGELNCLPDARYRAGYDLFELVSSPLAQECANSYLNYRPTERVRQVYAGGSNAGLIDFDMAAPDPTLRFSLMNAQGDAVWAPLELRASELTPGRTVWREKADALSLTRWDRAASGGGYYAPPGETESRAAEIYRRQADRRGLANSGQAKIDRAIARQTQKAKKPSA